tara:strand:+ start:154 stop:618 length:465 start_codon:yes stop_codon:yes gene_type:complete
MASDEKPHIASLYRDTLERHREMRTSIYPAVNEQGRHLTYGDAIVYGMDRVGIFWKTVVPSSSKAKVRPLKWEKVICFTYKNTNATLYYVPYGTKHKQKHLYAIEIVGENGYCNAYPIRIGDEFWVSFGLKNKTALWLGTYDDCARNNINLVTT